MLICDSLSYLIRNLTNTVLILINPSLQVDVEGGAWQNVFSPIQRKSVSLQKYLVMDKKQDVAYFLSFCIEQYKNAHHLLGGEALAVLNSYGVLEYLAEHYETLHTQSRQWLLEDIEEFISLRKIKVS